MDFTIEVMLSERGAANLNNSSNPKYRVLAPVAVYEHKSVPVVGMQRTGYLHVTSMPTPPAWGVLSDEEIRRRLNRVLCEQEWEMLPDGPRVKERRVWDADVTVLPPSIKDALLNERQATITWGQCKALFRHRMRAAQLAEGDFS